MANALYPKWKEAIIQASANSSLTGTLKVALVDAGTYTYSASHEFLTYTGGVLDGADVTFSAVAGAVSYEALVLYLDTGTAGTSRLVAYIDTGVTGLPVTSNGGDISVTWNASGIFAL
jgi:hypothetical protein